MCTWSRCRKNPGIQTTVVHSLAELIALTRNLLRKDSWGRSTSSWGSPRFFSNGIWFRGQRCADTPQPSIQYRSPSEKFSERYDEVTLFTDFRARLGFKEGMPTELEALPWMALMRHYELPNRVLDWSKSMLVALHFSVLEKNSISAGQHNRHLWVLNARALNEVTHRSTYLKHRMTADSHPIKPYIWFPDSFPAVLRAEQVRGRYPEQWMKVLKHSHKTSRGYPKKAKIFSKIEKILNEHEPRNRDEFIHAICCKNNTVSDYLWRLSTPAAVQPPWNNSRILAQKGLLTVHGGVLTDLPADRTRPIGPPAIDLEFIVEHCADSGMILRRIELDNVDGIREEIRALGSEYSDLMPETEYQVRSILETHGSEQEL